MSLIRELLLRLEAYEIDLFCAAQLSGADEELEIEGFSPEQIDYHLDLIQEANFTIPKKSPLRGGYYFHRLTWEGHDFRDSIRDPEIWAETKRGAENAGGLTVDLLKDLAKGFIKTKIEEHTGVKL